MNEKIGFPGKIVITLQVMFLVIWLVIWFPKGFFEPDGSLLSWENWVPVIMALVVLAYWLSIWFDLYTRLSAFTACLVLSVVGIYGPYLMAGPLDGPTDQYPLGVTGVGKIASPPGAYSRHPSISGDASFDFDLKEREYQRQDMDFKFRDAQFNFISDHMESIKVSGSRVTVSGTGRINGEEYFKYELEVIEGGQKGSDGIDRLRFMVWDRNHTTLIYDSMAGAKGSLSPIIEGSIEVDQKPQ